MEHGEQTNRGVAEDRRAVLLRRSLVDDHGQPEPDREVQLSLHRAALHLGTGPIPKVVEADLTDGDRAHDGDPRLQPRDQVGVELVRVLGMEPERHADTGVTRSERGRGLPADGTVPDVDDAGNAHLRRPRQHRGPVAVEGLVVHVGVGIDE